MSDRLEEIKERYSANGQVEDDAVNDRLLDLGTWPITEDIRWLISEVERIREENDRLKRFEDEVINMIKDINRERMNEQ
ncbi:hypothetical protein [Sporolactobacillus terrae]|uniref:hypothetical protein n=1 Tax=Sporolactobacillus terrae TaxID=269673 RepID=UPI00048BA142|nr:hypothetical protein [Sporolactobacillus terrae]